MPNERFRDRSSPAKRRGRGHGNMQPGPSSVDARSPKWSRDHVWGKRPIHALDQKGLTFLFQEQKRLKTALLRQSKLAKLAVEEVRSTQAEQLRWVNQRIADGFNSDGTGTNPFASRNLTDAQLKAEAVIRHQFIRTIGENTPNVPKPGVRPPSNRRRTNHNNVSEVSLAKRRTREEFLTLRGPLLRAWHRARDRGYRGTPSLWLRGPVARREVSRLRQKGILDPLWTGVLSVFDRHSPLRYAVTGCTATSYQVPRHGFHGERLYNQNRPCLNLVGQAHSVPRLNRKEWPRDLSGGFAWPTFPTFNESWEMWMRGKYPVAISSREAENFRSSKLPSKRVTPSLKVRTIANLVVGIRAQVAVPRKFLAYFKYRWGFLILKRNRPLPNDLASYLAGRWKVDISEMFLKFPIRYNDALRLTPNDKYYLSLGWVKGTCTPVAKRKRGTRVLRRLRLLKRESQLSADDSDHSNSTSDRGVRLC